jgi:hypothetical protein
MLGNSLPRAVTEEGNSMKAVPITIKWHSGLPIFASESFLKAVSDEYGWLGGIDESGKLRCILPYTIIRKMIFRMVRFRVETIIVGEELDVQEEKSFLNSVVEHFRSARADMIIPATTNTIFRTYPDGAIAAPYGTYIIDLNQPEETLWSNYHAKNRNIVRKAMKNRVGIRSGMEYVDTAYTLVRDTFKRSALPFMGYSSFNRMLSGFGENVKIFVADYQGIIQGCAVIPYSFHSAYSVYAGSIPEPVKGATQLLHWESIRLFRELGVQRYDFVGARINPKKGSKQEKLMLYKKHLGARLVQGYIWKCSLRPLKFAVYSLAVRFLRGGDIVDVERHKLKDSGSVAIDSSQDSNS